MNACVRVLLTLTATGAVLGASACASASDTAMRESVRAVGAVGAPPSPTATTAPVVADGTVGPTTADDTILLGFHAQDPRTTPLDKEISDEPYGITVQPGHEDFVRFVNSVLERRRADGSLQAEHDMGYQP